MLRRSVCFTMVFILILGCRETRRLIAADDSPEIVQNLEGQPHSLYTKKWPGLLLIVWYNRSPFDTDWSPKGMTQRKVLGKVRGMTFGMQHRWETRHYLVSEQNLDKPSVAEAFKKRFGAKADQLTNELGKGHVLIELACRFPSRPYTLYVSPPSLIKDLGDENTERLVNKTILSYRGASSVDELHDWAQVALPQTPWNLIILAAVAGVCGLILLNVAEPLKLRQRWAIGGLVVFALAVIGLVLYFIMQVLNVFLDPAADDAPLLAGLSLLAMFVFAIWLAGAAFENSSCRCSWASRWSSKYYR